MKSNRIERWLTAVVFGLVSLFLAVLGAAGLMYAIVSWAGGNASVFDAIGAVFGCACCEAFAWICYRFYVRPFVKKGDSGCSDA